MTYLSRNFLKRMEEREKLRALWEYQRFLVAEGLIPPMPTLWLRRCNVLLECVGGILLGTVIAAFTLLFSFFVFNFLLHIGA